MPEPEIVPLQTSDPAISAEPLLGELLISAGATSPIEVAVALDQQRAGDSRTCRRNFSCKRRRRTNRRSRCVESAS